MLSAEVPLSYSLRKEPAVKSCGMTADTSACQTAAGWTGVLLFCFCFFTGALGPAASLVSQKIVAGDILGDSDHQLQSLLLGCICPISVDIFSQNTV